MNKKILIALSLVVLLAKAMECSIEDQAQVAQVDTVDTISEVINLILVDDSKAELPIKYAMLSDTLKKQREDLQGGNSECIRFPFSLATWKLIEAQLERVYKTSTGENKREAIVADYRLLPNASLIHLCWALDYLEISLLKEIVLDLAQDKLTIAEISDILSPNMRNEVIKRRAHKIAGPVPFAKKLLQYQAADDADIYAVLATNDKIISGSSDTSIQIRDMNGNELAACYGHNDDICSLDIMDNDKIVSGSGDGTVRIWDMDGKQLQIFGNLPGYFMSVRATKDNKIVTGFSGQAFVADQVLRLWNMKGKVLQVFLGHEGGVNSVCISEDGKIIVSGSQDTTVRVWDVSGEQLAVCRGHEKAVRSVCITKDNVIVSASEDGTVRYWDMKGNQLAILTIGSFEDVLVTEDNRIILQPSASPIDSSFQGLRMYDSNGTYLGFSKDILGTAAFVTKDNKILSGQQGHIGIYDRRDITINNRLSAMNQEQAKSIAVVLERTRKLLESLKDELIANEGYLMGNAKLLYECFPGNPRNPQAFGQFRLLNQTISKVSPRVLNVLSEHCWQEIEGILNNETLVENNKRRAENDSHPAKKVRISEEPINEEG